MIPSSIRKAGWALLPLALVACRPWPAETNPFTTTYPVTDFGRSIDDLYVLITYITVVIGVVVFAILGYILFRFRDDGSPGNPEQIHGNPQLEVAWTLLPVGIVIFITIPTISTIFELADTPPDEALEIRVVGKRWWWHFEYLDQGIVTANDLHIPAGRPISLRLESDTVIHSFWTPQLGGKRDLVPGRANRMWFTVDAIPERGTTALYRGECAEYCGEAHALMRYNVIVHHPEDFEAWVQDIQEPYDLGGDALAEKGEELFNTKGGCAGCHQVTGNPAARGVQGPSLTNFATRTGLAAMTVGNDLGWQPEVAWTDAYTEAVRLWLKDPDAVKPGTTKEANPSRGLDGMNIPVELTDEDVDALVAYLQALK